MRNCINCGEKFNGKYCNECGQKAKVERITFSYIWHGLVHFFTHAEKGFLYTSWQMLVAPGHTVINFIKGRRKNYQPPISYYLIWIGIYILALYSTEKFFGEDKVISFVGYFGPEEKTKYAISHMNIVLTVQLLFQALYVYLVLAYRIYNYFEALVAVLYSIGTILLLQFVFVIMGISFYLLSGISMNIRITDILKVLYIGWFMFDFTKLLPVKYKFMRAMVVMILAFGTFTVWKLFVFPKVAELFFN